MLEEQVHQLRAVPPEEAPKNGKLRVKLISPLKEVFSMEADKILLPAVDGDILILPNRAPIFLSLKAGLMVIYVEGQAPLNYFISAGICEVRRNLCPVLAWGFKEEKMDVGHVQTQLKKAEDILRQNKTKTYRKEVATRIDFFHRILELTGYSKNLDASVQTQNDEEKN